MKKMLVVIVWLGGLFVSTYEAVKENTRTSSENTQNATKV